MVSKNAVRPVRISSMPANGWPLPKTTWQSSAKCVAIIATSIVSTSAKSSRVSGRAVATNEIPSFRAERHRTLRDLSSISQGAGAAHHGTGGNVLFEIHVHVDVFERRGKGCEQVVGQRIEEQPADQG